jgi:hypothetical protein
LIWASRLEMGAQVGVDTAAFGQLFGTTGGRCGRRGGARASSMMRWTRL